VGLWVGAVMVPTPETALTSTAFQQDAWRHRGAMLHKCRKSTNLQVRAASRVLFQYQDIHY
jgi:hypothetical protein